MCLWGPLNVKYRVVFHSIYHLNFPPNERMCVQLSSKSLLIWSSVSSLSLALCLYILHANCNSLTGRTRDRHIHSSFRLSFFLSKTTSVLRTSVQLVVVYLDFFVTFIIAMYKNSILWFSYLYNINLCISSKCPVPPLFLFTTYLLVPRLINT